MRREDGVVKVNSSFLPQFIIVHEFLSFRKSFDFFIRTVSLFGFRHLIDLLLLDFFQVHLNRSVFPNVLFARPEIDFQIRV